jgi:hypothetical protein
MRIVALAGPKGSGKNTLADMIEDVGFGSDDVEQVAFADPLRWAADALGLTGAVAGRKDAPCTDLGGHTGREFLVGLGEMLRGFNPEFFTAHMRERLGALALDDRGEPAVDAVVVTDLRRVNEVEALRAWAAETGNDIACLWIERPGRDADEVLQPEVRSKCVVISNAGDLDDLAVKAAAIAEWAAGGLVAQSIARVAT